MQLCKLKSEDFNRYPLLLIYHSVARLLLTRRLNGIKTLVRCHNQTFKYWHYEWATKQINMWTKFRDLPFRPNVHNTLNLVWKMFHLNAAYRVFKVILKNNIKSLKINCNCYAISQIHTIISNENHRRISSVTILDCFMTNS